MPKFLKELWEYEKEIHMAAIKIAERLLPFSLSFGKAFISLFILVLGSILVRYLVVGAFSIPEFIIQVISISIVVVIAYFLSRTWAPIVLKKTALMEIEQLQKEKQNLEMRLKPTLAIHNLHFKKAIRHHDQFVETTYDLLLECSNPPENATSINDIKVWIISGDSAFGDLSKWRLRFKDDLFDPEPELNPGESKYIQIATFYKSSLKPMKFLINIIKPDGARMSNNEHIPKETVNLIFRVSGKNQSAQQYEVLFGLKSPQLLEAALSKILHNTVAYFSEKTSIAVDET
jgi:hypothetical protein